MIHVMAATGLRGAAMAAPVVGYDAIAVLEEEQHLRIPIIGRQRPAVTENDGLTRAPVLEIDLCSIFGGGRVHEFLSLCLFDFVLKRNNWLPGSGPSTKSKINPITATQPTNNATDNQRGYGLRPTTIHSAKKNNR